MDWLTIEQPAMIRLYLSGRSTNTWKNSKDTATHNCSADLLNSNVAAGVGAFIRPVICHSMGGFIAKRVARSTAVQSDDRKYILAYTGPGNLNLIMLPAASRSNFLILNVLLVIDNRSFLLNAQDNFKEFESKTASHRVYKTVPIYE